MLGAMPNDDLVDEQIRYYDARAAEYDRMLEGEGRYDLDARPREDRDSVELATVAAAYERDPLTGDVLEVACGTGWWTMRLARHATSVTALDASAEMLAIHARRVTASNVARHQADIFAWTPDRAYDGVFFSFWLSHVPPDLFERFWALVARCLRPGGRVFWVDEFEWDARDGVETSLDDARGGTLRQLEDGRAFRLVKVYLRPEELQRRLAGLEWEASITPVGSRMYFGKAALR